MRGRGAAALMRREPRVEREVGTGGGGLGSDPGGGSQDAPGVGRRDKGTHTQLTSSLPPIKVTDRPDLPRTLPCHCESHVPGTATRTGKAGPRGGPGPGGKGQSEVALWAAAFPEEPSKHTAKHKSVRPCRGRGQKTTVRVACIQEIQPFPLRAERHKINLKTLQM